MLPINTYSKPTKNIGNNNQRIFGEIISRIIFLIKTLGDVLDTNFRFDSPGDGFNIYMGMAPRREMIPKKMNMIEAESCQPLDEG